MPYSVRSKWQSLRVHRSKQNGPLRHPTGVGDPFFGVQQVLPSPNREHLFFPMELTVGATSNQTSSP